MSTNRSTMILCSLLMATPLYTYGFVTPQTSSNHASSLPFLTTTVESLNGYNRGLSKLNMQPSSSNDEATRRGRSLSAFTTIDDISDATFRKVPDASFIEGTLLPIISSALLITGNTVGAGMLVLPELAAGPGMTVSTGVLVASFLMNLISGLSIAEVAINQKESSGDDVPSSFKEFAEVNLNGAFAGNMVAAISVFSNALILAFDSSKAGQVLSTLSGGLADSNTLSLLWGAMFVGLVTTQGRQNLSQVASVLVLGLFTSFAALLLPGLANVADPLQVLTSSSPLSSVDIMSQVLHIMPVFITTLVFQNIVPTVTRILDYDRVKTTAAVVLGSSIPLVMYISWCVAVLGGGVDTSSFLGGGASSIFMTIFTMATVGGSSLGTITSLSEEFEIVLSGLFGKDSESSSTVATTAKETLQQQDGQVEETFSFEAVILPVVMSLMIGQFFAADITGALEVAGSFGSPLLYGAIPVAMAMMQRQAAQEKKAFPSSGKKQQHIGVVPGGMASLGTLGLGATAFVGSELVQTCTSFL